MEHPYNLLQIVVKQHYVLRPEVLEKTNQIMIDYNNDKISYAQTLSAIYQVMNDLPSDILLYYLTTVPLPKNEEIETTDSPLPGLVKRLLVPSYHNSVRPVLLKYLNENAPEFSGEKVKSVIDDNIKQSKRKFIKIAKNKKTKTYQVKSLGLLCANNIWKFFNYYQTKYNKLRHEALEINDNQLKERIIKDSEKKLKWLNMFKTGHVPLEILEEEYGDSEIFYLERRHLLNNLTEEMLQLQPDLIGSIDDLVERLSE